MIEKNLGHLERIVRLLAGVLLLAVALSQPILNGVDVFVGAVSLALILNGIFSRCYLWFLLGINTAKDPDCTHP